MKKISQGIVMDIPFPTGISLKKQKHIVSRLDALQKELNDLKLLQIDSVSELRALLPSILDQAFKGRVEI